MVMSPGVILVTDRGLIFSVIVSVSAVAVSVSVSITTVTTVAMSVAVSITTVTTVAMSVAVSVTTISVTVVGGSRIHPWYWQGYFTSYNVMVNLFDILCLNVYIVLFYLGRHCKLRYQCRRPSIQRRRSLRVGVRRCSSSPWPHELWNQSTL